MEIWLFIIISLCVATLLKSLYDFLFPKRKLPPGPTTVPIIGNLQWLLISSLELEPILRNLHTKYGPIITLQMGFHPAIFISTNSLAHKMLVQNGVVFANRPEGPANRIVLISRLQGHSESGESVQVVDHFRYAMFCLLVLMCFGDKLEEKQIQEIETIQRRLFKQNQDSQESEKRKLNEGEMIGLCSEFLDGGTDTTSTALQWIMANIRWRRKI
ncbi:unnamed protein product, partial [Vitis vinifera]